MMCFALNYVLIVGESQAHQMTSCVSRAQQTCLLKGVSAEAQSCALQCPRRSAVSHAMCKSADASSRSTVLHVNRTHAGASSRFTVLHVVWEYAGTCGRDSGGRGRCDCPGSEASTAWHQAAYHHKGMQLNLSRLLPRCLKKTNL